MRREWTPTASMSCWSPFPGKCTPNRGEYYLLDKSEGTLVDHVIFQCPGPEGKGVLVSPTVHGNLIAGPNAEPVTDRLDLGNTVAGMDFVRARALKSVPGIQFRQNIRNFSGIRANTDQGDFLIGASPNYPGFIDLAGIKSPGLSSAPAIGKRAAELVAEAGLPLEEKTDFCDERHVVRFRHLSPEEKNALIAKDPRYGRVICRCETITEGEIVDALHGPVPACTVNGVKRRCNAGMGRCQGGFCGPRVQEIISRELGIPPTEILLEQAGQLAAGLRDKTAEGGFRPCMNSSSSAAAPPGSPPPAKPGRRACAISWSWNGIKELGGILNQCIHNGFGLQRFKEELTGPEYAGRFIDMLQKTGVEVQLDTMVLQIVPGKDGALHQVHAVNGKNGYQVLETRAVVLAMGCRERTRGAIAIPGERPAGIFTAGAAQRYLNIEGYMVGRRVIILGSGDIGLIMARRMTLEGAKVLACVEVMPYSSGLTRNIVQCLERLRHSPLSLPHHHRHPGPRPGGAGHRQ